MYTLTDIEWAVLNETLDDAENLEQLYHALAFLGDVGRQDEDDDSASTLAEIAEAIRSLVDEGLLVVRRDPQVSQSDDDLSYVWQAWFEPSPKGREVVLADQHNGDAEATWDAELARRMHEIEQGEVDGQPIEQVMAELRARY